MKAFLPAMVARNRGNIVTIGSLGAFVGISGQVDYSASKAGSVAFSEALRRELTVDILVLSRRALKSPDTPPRPGLEL